MNKKIFSQGMRMLNVLTAVHDVTKASAVAVTQNYAQLAYFPLGTGVALATIPLTRAHEYLDEAALAAYDAAYDQHQTRQAEVREDCRQSLVILGRALQAVAPEDSFVHQVGAVVEKTTSQVRDGQLDAYVARARARGTAFHVYAAAPVEYKTVSPKPAVEDAVFGNTTYERGPSAQAALYAEQTVRMPGHAKRRDRMN